MVVLGSILFLGVGCTDSASPTPDDASDPGSDVEVDDLGQPDLDNFEFGDVDGVIRMLPPSGAVPMNAPTGPGGSIVSQRPILSIVTPTGPVDLFEMRVSDAEMGAGLQSCSVVIERDGMSATCGPAGEMNDFDVGVVGISGSDRSSIYELAGPPTMTHFLVDLGDERFAVTTREGRALLHVAQAFCVDGPLIVSAWQGDREIEATAPDPC